MNFVLKNEIFCIKNEYFCIKNGDFVLKMMTFAVLHVSGQTSNLLTLELTRDDGLFKHADFRLESDDFVMIL